jgi:hypothetical protein
MRAANLGCRAVSRTDCNANAALARVRRSVPGHQAGPRRRMGRDALADCGDVVGRVGKRDQDLRFAALSRTGDEFRTTYDFSWRRARTAAKSPYNLDPAGDEMGVGPQSRVSATVSWYGFVSIR